MILLISQEIVIGSYLFLMLFTYVILEFSSSCINEVKWNMWNSFKCYLTTVSKTLFQSVINIKMFNEMLNIQDITTFLLSLGLVLCAFINATNLNSNQSYLIPQQPWVTVATTVVGTVQSHLNHISWV